MTSTKLLCATLCSVKKMTYQRFVNTHLLCIISKTTSFISSIWGNCANQVDSVTFGEGILTMINDNVQKEYAPT